MERDKLASFINFAQANRTGHVAAIRAIPTAPYLQMHVIHVPNTRAPEALNEAPWRAIGTMHGILYAPSELALVERSGVQEEESAPRADPMVAHTTEFGAIPATSLSPARANVRLAGATAVRVGKMIRARSLHALRPRSPLEEPNDYEKGSLSEPLHAHTGTYLKNW